MKRTARRSRAVPRLAAFALVVACAPVLAGCSPASNVAVRLNADGTVDFLSCQSQEVVDEVVANVYVRTDESTMIDLVLEGSTPDAVDPGDILRFLGAPADDSWDRLYVGVYGAGFGSSGREYPSSLSTVVDRSSLEVGEWEWPLWTARCDPGE